MPMIIDMDIFTVTEGVICHQVNCQGKMGKGIALEIKRRFPTVFNRYKLQCFHGNMTLGKVLMIGVSDKLCIANLAGQDRYGRDKRYTDYDAVRMCLQKVKKWADEHHAPVYIPYKMGCSNAGGDWDVVYKIIEEEIPNAIICRIPDSDYK